MAPYGNTVQKEHPAEIHPTAVVEEGARLGPGVTIGAYAFVGAGVVLGAGCRLHHHATVEGLTFLGRDCEVYPYACVGLKSQDLKYRGGRPGLRAGNRNVFREFCTIHAATPDGEFTVIGDDCLFLAYSHVAHDCHVGNGVIMSNNATLAGHVRVDDFAIIGGLSGVHQFCQIGTRAMIGGCSKVEKDVPPFLIGDGHPAVIHGVNTIGLQRAGYPEETVAVIKQAYRTLYREGLNRTQALEKLAAHPEAESPEIRAFLNFAEKSQRGFAPAAQR
jgi:UDP-N-acetylglucosamine acyltransferase